MALGPGSRLGPYEISGPLGKGGMGDVFRARDTRLERDVAVKSLPPGFESDPERLARFQREARVLASLNHPNVGSIYGFEESADGHAYLILECIEGETLASRLAGGWPLPMDEALRIAAEIASGLGAAHDAGIIHRDLKPANVMLRPDGAVKVLDFGLAKTAERRPASGEQSGSPTISLGTQTGIILGTAAYMSPEQARGRALDKRTDIFSFGCVLYECLTGRRAFPGESVSDTLSAIVADEPNWAALPPSTPTRVRELLRRCLQKDPRKRLHDIADARLELEEAMTPSHDAETVSTAPFENVPARARAPWAWLLAGSLLGAAAAGAFLWSRTPAPPPPARRLQASLTLPEGVLAGLGSRPAVALSPDGSVVVFRGVESGTTRLYRRRLDGGDAMPIEGTEQASGPFFSPDGEWIGFFTRSELRKIPLTGGASVRVCTVPAVSHGGTWGTDGWILYARTPNEALSRVSDKGGTPEPFSSLAAGEHAHQFPQALPERRGTLVRIVKGHDFEDLDGAQIAILEPGSLKRHVLLEGSQYARYVSDGRLIFVRGRGLFTIGIDLARWKTVGSPEPVAGNFVVDWKYGIAHFDAANGVLVGVSGAGVTSDATPVFAVNREGKGSALPLPPGEYSHPRLSPDGKQIALVRWNRQSGKIYLFERERQVLTLLTPEPGRFFAMAWSPDGRQLAYAWYNDKNPRLAVRRVDGSREPETPTPVRDAEFPASWSPDGRLVAYTVVHGIGDSRGTSEIWTAEVNGTHAGRPWLAIPYDTTAPNFSPDGRFIAYVSNESGKDEVYLRPFPGPGTRTKISRDGGAEPAWTRGGKEILYRLGDQFLSVEISAGESPVPRAPQVLFSGPFASGHREDWPREYDVSADGNELIVRPRPVPPAFAPRQLSVQTGWRPSGAAADTEFGSRR
ncbi:MAG: protein kinase [Acidobacteriota bacterium]|nr:protein kinase [Acidobacteriota bacterium]